MLREILTLGWFKTEETSPRGLTTEERLDELLARSGDMESSSLDSAIDGLLDDGLDLRELDDLGTTPLFTRVRLGDAVGAMALLRAIDRRGGAKGVEDKSWWLMCLFRAVQEMRAAPDLIEVVRKMLASAPPDCFDCAMIYMGDEAARAIPYSVERFKLLRSLGAPITGQAEEAVIRALKSGGIGAPCAERCAEALVEEGVRFDGPLDDCPRDVRDFLLGCVARHEGRELAKIVEGERKPTRRRI